MPHFGRFYLLPSAGDILNSFHGCQRSPKPGVRAHLGLNLLAVTPFLKPVYAPFALGNVPAPPAAVEGVAQERPEFFIR